MRTSIRPVPVPLRPASPPAVRAELLPRPLAFGLAVVLVAAASDARAGGFAPLTAGLTNIQTALVALGILIVSIAIMWAGYKIAFAGATIRDVQGPFLGGILAGGAVPLAGWLFGG